MHSTLTARLAPARFESGRFTAQKGIGILLTAVACVASGQMGFAFTGSDAFFSPFWPMSGVAAGCVLLGGPWMAIGVYVGVSLQNGLAGLQEWTSYLGPAGIVVESLLVYWILSRLLGPRPRLTDLRGAFGFLLLAPWLSAAINGLVGVGLLYADEATMMEHSGREFSVFVMANGSSIAFLSPLFAVWTSKPESVWWKRFAFLAPLVLATAWFVFYAHSAWPLYALFPPLLASAVMLGLRGNAIFIAAVTVGAVFALRSGLGPFADQVPTVDAYARLYAFIFVLALCSTGVAAIVGQYRRRLTRAARGAGSAGLSFWHWDSRGGWQLDRIDDDCLLADRVMPEQPTELLFNPAEDRGTREMQFDGHPVLSFWEVTRRLPSGEAAAADGVLLDLSERLSLEQARRQAWQSEVELRNLRASLAPHLLFNCLAAVRGIVRSDPERARKFIDHLARFLRESTDAQSRETIPLLEEWHLCEDFLALQGMRFERDLPRLAEIKGAAYHARIPPMMLLNLVENAVKHGTIDQGHPLIVNARLSGQWLDISVRNHGTVGPQPTTRPGGLGVARARLRAIYGDNASLDITESNGEVTAAMHLPAEPPKTSENEP